MGRACDDDQILADAQTNFIAVTAALLIAAMVISGSWLVQASMRGPAFLVSFVVAFLVILAGSEAVWRVARIPGIHLVGFVAVWGIAYARLHFGVSHGMRKFDLLIMMMLVLSQHGMRELLQQ